MPLFASRDDDASASFWTVSGSTLAVIAGDVLDVFDNDLKCPLREYLFGEAAGGAGGGGVGSATIVAEIG